MHHHQTRLSVIVLCLACITALADITHVAPNLSTDLNAFTGGVHTRLVWVQRQFISDDTTKFLHCGGYFTNWLSNQGTQTKLIGFDSKEGVGRVLDSVDLTHVRPIIDQTGNLVFWNDLINKKSWVKRWGSTTKKVLLADNSYFVLCTWFDKTTSKEYVYAAAPSTCDDFRCQVRTVVRYELDLTGDSVRAGTAQQVFTGATISTPWNVASDGITAGGNMPWPNAHTVNLTTGGITKVNTVNANSCHANLAPDGSSRFFHSNSAHTEIYLYNATRTNTLQLNLIRRIPRGDSAWDFQAPKWTNHVKFITLGAPLAFWGVLANSPQCNPPPDPRARTWKEGETGEFYLGKFNDAFNDVEIIRITDGDWRFRKLIGDAWLATGAGPGSQTGVDFFGKGENSQGRSSRTAVVRSGEQMHDLRGRVVFDARVSAQLHRLPSGVYLTRSSQKTGSRESLVKRVISE